MPTASTAALLASLLVCVAVIILIKPLLMRYALARPNARSSHVTPTPQGGGIAVVVAVVGVTPLVSSAFSIPIDWTAFAALAFTSVALAALGAFDDIMPLPAPPRLVAQLAAVALLIAFTEANGRILPADWPLWLEFGLLVVAGTWFVNLVNFMDGLDWMTVAEMVPLTAALALFGVFGHLASEATLVAAALCGAMLGFAFFNKPVARLFLGDVGSLPIGLVVAWLLYVLATGGHLAAALLLPLYYCADATLTLLRRLARREPVWEAHRTHFYQRATDNGFSAMDVARHVFCVNTGLALLAAASLLAPSPLVAAASLLAGGALVAWLLLRFARPRRRDAARSR